MELFIKSLSDKEINQILDKFGNYFKIMADIELGLMVVGCKLHVDAVPMLKGKGGVENDMWGGWVNLEDKMIETNAVWNIRDGNPSMEILDNEVRSRFINLVKEYFGNVFIK